MKIASYISGFFLTACLIATPIGAQYLYHTGPDWLRNEPIGLLFSAIFSEISLAIGASVCFLGPSIKQ